MKNNWYWDKKSDALIWFYIDPKKLAAQFRHWGPPIKLIEHATAFRKEWKKYKVKEFRGKLYVDLPRKIRTTNDFLVELKQSKDINVKILC